MTYLNKFFSEKNLAPVIFDITSETDGAFHIIESDLVIEMIHGTTGDERAFIETTIRKIDFANGDINHFLRFLAQQIANNY